MNISEQIIAFVKEMVNERGHSYRDVARKLRITPSQVNKIVHANETGDTVSFNVETVEKMFPNITCELNFGQPVKKTDELVADRVNSMIDEIVAELIDNKSINAQTILDVVRTLNSYKMSK